ncbi:MAG: DnaJ domain-containing protein [Calditrichaceae bacterium]|nr:J domain-containing protein [Calditrichia bacterium]NUQ43566.1 DnaJ domain-containing protein [Calditrichaceae bacterium]
MPIISRLFRLLRANFHSITRKESATGRGAGEKYRRQEQHREKRASSGYGSGKSWQDATQDPLLAQYYANLEVPYGSDLETVRRAWKNLLRKYHPDRHSGDPEKQAIANQLVQELNHAFQELEKRLS